MRQKTRHLREASASQTKLAMHPNWHHFTPKNHNLLHNNFMWQNINIKINEHLLSKKQDKIKG
jgi:hypothetical protein